MFASNFTIADSHFVHVRGQDNLRQFGQDKTIASSHKMTNFFCQTCGTLMYRVGTAFPGASILRLGTVDDSNLVEGKLKPRLEQFVKDRASWLDEVKIDGITRTEGMGP